MKKDLEVLTGDMIDNGKVIEIINNNFDKLNAGIDNIDTFLLEEVQDIRQNHFKGIELAFGGLRSDINILKSDINTLKNDVNILKNVKKDVSEIKETLNLIIDLLNQK